MEITLRWFHGQIHKNGLWHHWVEITEIYSNTFFTFLTRQRLLFTKDVIKDLI